MNKENGERKGFTLVECMVVVAMLGILSAVSVASYVRFMNKARRSESMVNMKSIVHGAVVWFQEEHTDSLGEPMKQHFPTFSSPYQVSPFNGTNIYPQPTSYVPDNSLPCSGFSKNTGVWNVEPWVSLKFSVNKAHHFSYSYWPRHNANLAHEFRVTSKGDLDCDGKYSLRLMIGRVQRTTGEIELENYSNPMDWANVDFE